MHIWRNPLKQILGATKAHTAVACVSSSCISFCPEQYRHTVTFFSKNLNCFVVPSSAQKFHERAGLEDDREADKNNDHLTQSLLFSRLCRDDASCGDDLMLFETDRFNKPQTFKNLPLFPVLPFYFSSSHF